MAHSVTKRRPDGQVRRTGKILVRRLVERAAVATTVLGLVLASAVTFVGAPQSAIAAPAVEQALTVADNGSGSWISRDGVSSIDQDLAVDISIDTGSQAGVLVRTNGTGADPTGYYAALNAANSTIMLMRAGTWDALSSCVTGLSTGQTALPANITRGQTYRLRLIAHGTQIQVALNGAVVISCTDSTTAAGGVGLRTYQASAHFDNAVLGGTFSDDFQDGDAAGWTAHGGTWAVVPVSADPKSLSVSNNGGGPWLARTGFSATDVDLSADLTVHTGGAQAGLLVRTDNPGAGVDPHGYYGAINAADGTVMLMRAGTWTALTSCTAGLAPAVPVTLPTGQYSVPASISASIAYRLRLVAQGSHIQLYLNGALRVDCTDSTWTSGGIGLRTYQAAADFDNVVAGAGAMSFTDDFQDGNQNGWDTRSGSWVVGSTAAVEHVLTVGNNLSGPWISPDGISGTDQDLSADVQAREGNQAGLLVRTTDTSQDPRGYYAAIDTNKDALLLMRAGTWDSLNSCTVGLATGQVSLPTALERAHTYRLRLTAIGSTVSVYLDGTLRMQCTDATTTSGGVGLRTYQAEGQFDNVAYTGVGSASETFERGSLAAWSAHGGTWGIRDIPVVLYPTFTGSANPVPATGVTYDPSSSYLNAVLNADVAAGAGSAPGHDFWVDRMLVRNGLEGSPSSDGNENLDAFTRGRAVYMRQNDQSKLGWGGHVAYWDDLGKDAFTLTLSSTGTAIPMSESTAARRQLPSYYDATYTGTGIGVHEIKYITENDVMVAQLDVTNTNSVAQSITVTGSSPLAGTASGSELTGTVATTNALTTVHPRFSGDSFSVSGSSLTRTASIAAGATGTFKVQLGMLVDEIPTSASDYQRYRAMTAAQAFTDQVTTYNRWWADNIVYVDSPEHNIDKWTFYRWWLVRFNHLDANIPGNDFQFSTAVEGALGYNNSISISDSSLIDDLKYLRDPAWSYGTTLSLGETSKGSWLADNPGDPAFWSAAHGFPYLNYVADASLRAYDVQGGSPKIAAKFAQYFEGDVNGMLGIFDSNKNFLLDFNRGDITGTDSDAVAFFWPDQNGKNRTMDRTETSFLYADAIAAAHFFHLAGDSAGEQRMTTMATTIRSQILALLWDGSNTQDSSGATGNTFKQKLTSTGDLVPWKEVSNFLPFAEGVVPHPGEAGYNANYTEALRFLADPAQFPTFPFYFSDQQDKASALLGRGTNNDGQSNNFSSQGSMQMFRIYAAAIRDYSQDYVTAADFKKLLYWNAWSQYIDGDNTKPDANEFFHSATSGQIGYRSWIHHDTLAGNAQVMVEDLGGLTPRDDSTVELNPIDVGWSYYTVNNIRYHGADMSIVWNSGNHYNGVPNGYSLYLNGHLAFTIDSLKHVLFNTVTGQITLPNGGSIVASTSTPISAATAVSFASGAPVVNEFALAGVNIDPTTISSPDLAVGQPVQTTFAETGRPGTAAVDGTTVNEPFWGTKGSPNASDSITVDLGSPKTIDDVRLYFYRTSSSATVPGYAPPASYQVEYLNGTTWTTVPNPQPSSATPIGNFNELKFTSVTASKIRLTVTHSGSTLWTGLKELQTYSLNGG